MRSWESKLGGNTNGGAGRTHTLLTPATPHPTSQQPTSKKMPASDKANEFAHEFTEEQWKRKLTVVFSADSALNPQVESDDTASNDDKDWDRKAAVKSEMGEISKKTVDLWMQLMADCMTCLCSKSKLLPSMWSKE